MMPRKIAVRVLHECFIDGKYRKPGQMFLVDRGLFDHPDKLPSCLQRITCERHPDDMPKESTRASASRATSVR